MSLPAVPTTTLQGAVPLTDWGVIAARGTDSRKFLHGQLTQDFLGLGPDDARLAGYCSPKGRLLATFVGWADAGNANDVLLACSADLLAPTLKRLSMFVMRSQCKLSDVSTQVVVFGLAGEVATAHLGAAAPPAPWLAATTGSARVIRLPDAAGVARYLLAQPAMSPAPALPLMDAETWRWLEVQSGVARVVAATAEQFVPQMVNLELVGGVNFQKGCFPGQEIVARSQYRGTVKRRAHLFETDAAAQPGAEVYSASDPGQPAGMVAAAARVPGGEGRVGLLVETKLAALAGTLHLNAADGPLLRPCALPYTIPVDA